MIYRNSITKVTLFLIVMLFCGNVISADENAITFESLLQEM